MGGQRDGRIVEGVPRLGFIRRAPAAAAAALRREITRGSLKTCRKSEVRLECSPGISTYACGSADARTCVRAFKERPRRRGETPRRRRRGALTARTCAPRAARVRVCLKRNIFLYYYSHRAYFSYPPTCIPGGWVCSFSLSVFFCLSFRNASRFLSSPLLLGTTGKIQPRTRAVPFLRAHRHEKLRGAPSSARESRGNGAHLLSALPLSRPSSRVSAFLSFSFYDRAAIAAPALT